MKKNILTSWKYFTRLYDIYERYAISVLRHYIIFILAYALFVILG